MDSPFLRDLVILVATAIPVAAVAHRLRVPTVVGFLVAGMAIGPYALGLIGRAERVSELADAGVVLLLFAIGLELSLSRVMRMGRVVLQGGGLQVAGTIGAVAVLALAWGELPARALFYGSLVALSSTAIVLKVYSARGELDTPHGRVVVGVSLFQDFCLVPLMLLVPLLAGAGAGVAASLARIGMGLAVVAALVAAGQVAVPRVLERVVGLRNRELFTLCVVFFGLGAAYLTSRMGLSLALGAFIAGLIISESEYGIQALSDVLPFRDTFSGIFFTSVGMLLDLGHLVRTPVPIIGAAAGVIVLKTLVAAAAVRSLHRPFEVSLVSGLGLAQIGEFSFVLAGSGAALGLLAGDAYQVFLGASVVTMLAAPFLIASAGVVAERLARLARRPPLALAADEASRIGGLRDHVIVVGYGLNGRNVARALKAAEIPYVVLEQNGQLVRRGRAEGEPILFGDGTRHEVLERVGIARARVVVFAIAAPADERSGVAAARHLAAQVRIIARTRYVAAIEDLRRLGADEVVPEEFETSLEIFARVLRVYGIPGRVIQREVAAARGEHYEMLRGLSGPGHRLETLWRLGVQPVVETVEVEEGACAVGENATTLRLRSQTGATVLAVVRGGQALYEPDPAFRFRSGDTVALVGTHDAIERGTALFRAAGARRAPGGEPP